MEIQEIGEQGLLKIIQQYCPPGMIGDDAAILKSPPEKDLIITTDMLVENIHFSEQTTSAQDTGWRAVAANLSDLAAMGATPLGITVALGLPPHTPVNWVEQLYQGMKACLEPYQTSILGGDLVRSPVKTLSITAIGQNHPHHHIHRHTAKPNQVLLATGFHGLSRAGLELLINPSIGQTLTPEEQKTLIRAHQRPQPRLDILPHLWKYQDPPESITISGMDSSDGLADAVIQICQGSQVGAIIYRDQLPISPIVQKLVNPETALDWTLYGGEDFELILCLPPKIGEEMITQLKTGIIIGETRDHPGIWLVDQQDQHLRRELTLKKGFQHFS